jgi:23S rRNA pseudouridine1911/1915/1917 synthase
VHRLDRPVAGVMVFARTSKAAARLSEQFRNGTARKVYLAVLEGKPKPDSAELIDYIVRRGNTALILPEPAAGSREARLCYRVLDSTGSRSLVEVTLETGRKHQIRLQLARRGHPVAGDMRYGASAPFRARQIALLASELSISHPTRRTLQRFRCPPPVGWPWPQVSRETAAPLWNWTDYGIR